MAEINQLKCKKGAYLIPQSDNEEESLRVAAESPSADDDLTWWNRPVVVKTDCSEANSQN